MKPKINLDNITKTNQEYIPYKRNERTTLEVKGHKCANIEQYFSFLVLDCY